MVWGLFSVRLVLRRVGNQYYALGFGWCLAATAVNSYGHANLAFFASFVVCGIVASAGALSAVMQSRELGFGARMRFVDDKGALGIGSAGPTGAGAAPARGGGGSGAGLGIGAGSEADLRAAGAGARPAAAKPATAKPAAAGVGVGVRPPAGIQAQQPAPGQAIYIPPLTGAAASPARNRRRGLGGGITGGAGIGGALGAVPPGGIGGEEP